MSTYHASGKLLLTSEYVVLRGATALSLPTKKGQDITVTPSERAGLEWKAIDHLGEIWFHARFSPKGELAESTHGEISERLGRILKMAMKLGGEDPFRGIKAETRLGFDPDWGLGSSSTLIVIIAKWLTVDPMELFFATLSGSGYDVACGLENKPILYTLKDPERPTWKVVDWKPLDPDNWHFVYLGNKKRSEGEVRNFKDLKVSKDDIAAFDRLTHDLIRSSDPDLYRDIFREHENRLSRILGRSTVKETRFPDFDGVVKSLGAWGGDFCLALHEDTQYLHEYFRSRDLSIIQGFREIIHE